jgi:isoquinoline 1-oxidoreductase subunit beta
VAPSRALILGLRRDLTMKKRYFLLAAAGALGAVTVGWAWQPVRQRRSTATPLATAPGQVAFGGWVKISADGSVTVVMPKSEMGQGTHTGLAMVLADELDADWSRVRIEPSPIDKIYNNLATVVDGLPFHPDDTGAVKRFAGWMTAKTMREIGLMMTGGSSSIKDLWLPMREAGASARAMLVAAAASAWGVPVAEVRAAAGVLTHVSGGKPSGKQASYGDMAAAAGKLPLPASVTLKTHAQFTLIGQPLPRLEAASKANGTAGFGMDVQLPGLLYATVVMCPTLGGKVASFDAKAALALPGVKQVVQVDGYHGGTAGVAVVASTPWQALQGSAAVVVVWDEAVPSAAFDSTAAMAQLAKTLDSEDGFAYYSTGDVQAALKGAAKSLTAEYRAPWLAHTALEPMNCTVQFKDSKATVWSPTQVPGLARRAAALALGLTEDMVDVQVQLLGGGFGRRLEVDVVGQAAAIAKALVGPQAGQPLQVFWSREQDTQHDFYRPAAVSRFKAGLSASGELLAWHNSSAGQAIVPQVLARQFGLPGAGPDKTTSEGAYDQPYEWPAARVGHQIVELPFPVGFWRAVGHSHQAFFKESFLDECAHAAGADPVAYRLALLQRHPRQAAVLQKVAQMAGWGRPAAPASDGNKRALGVALHHSFGSTVAQVAEVSVDKDKMVRVHWVWCAIDCGTAVNPGLVAQQMESAVVFALTAALYGEITVEKGRVKQSNFHDYAALRINACPAIAVAVMPSTEHPEGVGEPGVPPLAPAVANAIFALTQQRLRSLPLRLA